MAVRGGGQSVSCPLRHHISQLPARSRCVIAYAHARRQSSCSGSFLTLLDLTDVTCILPRHPYFHESLIVMHPALELNDNDVGHLRSLDNFRNMRI